MTTGPNDIRKQRNISIGINIALGLVILHWFLDYNHPSSTPTQLIQKSHPTTTLQTPTLIVKEKVPNITCPEPVATQESNKEQSLCVPQVELMGPGKKYSVTNHLREDSKPTFERAHRVMYGKPSTDNVYKEFQNCGHRTPNSGYYHTNINQSFADYVVKTLNPQFMVEVGSFTGVSSVIFGNAIVNNGLRGKSFLLCIDTWLGDLNMYLNKPQFSQSLSWRAGQPEVYDQWMVHVIHSKLTDVILPLRQTSILGARFLKAVMWVADFIYLDSAHEVDETFNELVLYWDRLRPGGWLMGDDYVWRAVRHDVMKFVTVFNLELKRPSELLWYIVKPMDFQWPKSLFHKSFGYYQEDKNVFQDAAKKARYHTQLEKERQEALRTAN